MHVDAVEVGPFFAVDFDADEVRVHERGGFGVFETFLSHTVAPMTGAITDAQEYRFVFGARLGQGFFAPGIPLHGVVGVLEQVGRVFVDKMVGHGVPVNCFGSLRFRVEMPYRTVLLFFCRSNLNANAANGANLTNKIYLRYVVLEGICLILHPVDDGDGKMVKSVTMVNIESGVFNANCAKRRIPGGHNVMIFSRKKIFNANCANRRMLRIEP